MHSLYVRLIIPIYICLYDNMNDNEKKRLIKKGIKSMKRVVKGGPKTLVSNNKLRNNIHQPYFLVQLQKKIIFSQIKLSFSLESSGNHQFSSFFFDLIQLS